MTPDFPPRRSADREEQPTATVRELRREDGYGFLETSDGRDVYFHSHSVLNDDFGRLRPGTRVTFAEELGEKGPQASTVKLLGKHRSEEHTSELQSLMRNSYAVFCFNKKPI